MMQQQMMESVPVAAQKHLYQMGAYNNSNQMIGGSTRPL